MAPSQRKIKQVEDLKPGAEIPIDRVSALAAVVNDNPELKAVVEGNAVPASREQEGAPPNTAPVPAGLPAAPELEALDLRTEPSGKPGFVTYTLKQGDNPWDLETFFGLEYGTLQKFNHFEDVHNLPVGMKIWIPQDQIQSEPPQLRQKTQSNNGAKFIFRVPIESDTITKDEFMVKGFAVMFGFTREQSMHLIKQVGWDLKEHADGRRFHPPTKEELKQGFKLLRISRNMFESIHGKLEREELKVVSAEPALRETMSRLEGTAPIFLMIKRIKELEEQIDDLGGPLTGDDIATFGEYSQELWDLKINLAEELANHGFVSVEDFEEKVAPKLAQFERRFRNFAVETAFAMLRESEKQLRLEEKLLDNAEVARELMEAVRPLQPFYDQADTARKEALEMLIQRLTGVENLDRFSIDDLLDAFVTHERQATTEGLIGFLNFLSMFQGLEFETFLKKSGPIDALLTKANEWEDLARQAAALQHGDAFPILKDPTFPLRSVARLSDEGVATLQSYVKQVVAFRLEKVDQTRNILSDDPDKVWELTPVILVAMEKLCIQPRSLYGLLIQQKLEDVAINKLIWDIALTALGIIMGIAAIFTGGATAIVFTVLSAAVSGVEAFRALEDFRLHSAASGTHFDRARALSDEDPEVLWVVLAFLGVGLDLISVAKLLPKIKTIAKTFDKTTDPKIFDSLIKENQQALGLADDQVQTMTAKIQEIATVRKEFLEILDDIKADKVQISTAMEADQEIMQRLSRITRFYIESDAKDFKVFLNEFRGLDLDSQQKMILEKIFKEAKPSKGTLDDASKVAQEAASKKESVQVFRVEETVFSRISISDEGFVDIPQVLTNKGKGPERALFINIDQEERARIFLLQRAVQDKPTSIKSFDVDPAFVDQLRRMAVLEDVASSFPERPIRVDVTKAPDQFGLTNPEWIQKLRDAIIQGTGKVEIE